MMNELQDDTVCMENTKLGWRNFQDKTLQWKKTACKYIKIKLIELFYLLAVNKGFTGAI